MKYGVFQNHEKFRRKAGRKSADQRQRARNGQDKAVCEAFLQYRQPLGGEVPQTSRYARCAA